MSAISTTNTALDFSSSSRRRTFSTKVACVMTPGAMSSNGVTRWSQVPAAVVPMIAIFPFISSAGTRPWRTSVADQAGKSRYEP